MLLEFIVARNQANRKSNCGKNWIRIDLLRAVKPKTLPASTHDEINNKNASRAKNIVFQEAPEEHNPASYPSDPESKSWVDISYPGQFATIKSRKKTKIRRVFEEIIHEQASRRNDIVLEEAPEERVQFL